MEGSTGLPTAPGPYGALPISNSHFGPVGDAILAIVLPCHIPFAKTYLRKFENPWTKVSVTERQPFCLALIFTLLLSYLLLKPQKFFLIIIYHSLNKAQDLTIIFELPPITNP